MVYIPGVTDRPISKKLQWNEAQTFPFIDVLKDPGRVISPSGMNCNSIRVVLRLTRKLKSFFRIRILVVLETYYYIVSLMNQFLYAEALQSDFCN